MELLTLFWVFAKIGAVTFGGGLAMLPILQREIVDKRSWADEEELLDYCRKNIAKYAMPYDIEFKEDMPKTLVGKVAYRVLEEEEIQKNNLKEQ